MFPRVVVVGFYSGGVVHDSVHDGVGVGASGVEAALYELHELEHVRWVRGTDNPALAGDPQ